MKASRLLSILMLLQSRGRQSAQSLASTLEVSVRTIYRDIDQLSAAGVPVWAENGRLGGFELQPGWKTPLTGMTVPEARAVFLAGLPGPAAELGLGEAMASAQLKLMAALPDQGRNDADRVAGCFHLDPSDWYHATEPPPHLRDVAGAVWDRQRLRIRYQSWNQETDKVVEPLGLVLMSGHWYLVARASRAGAEPRSHRVDAIRTLQRLPEHFTPPGGFSLPTWWAGATARFEASLEHGRARLRVTESGLARLQQLGTRQAEHALAAARPCDREGWIETEVPIESIEHAARELLRLGDQGEVLSPAKLRRRLARAHRAAATLYTR